MCPGFEDEQLLIAPNKTRNNTQEHPETVGHGDLEHIVAKSDNDENSRIRDSLI